jgi:predicted nucleic acid-binding protein
VKAQPPRLAVDSNLLFAIANAEPAVAMLLDLAKRGEAQLYIPPECLAELSYSYVTGNEVAGKVLRSILKIALLSPLNLTSTQHAVAASVARRFLVESILPKLEKRDAMALAQAAAGGMTGFITQDEHFLGIDRRQLSALLLIEELSPIAILAPIDFVKAAFRARQE